MNIKSARSLYGKLYIYIQKAREREREIIYIEMEGDEKE
jgi:hypothetical protein